VDTVRVFIDSALNSDWTYDAVENKVLFTVIPPSNSLVEIGYVIDEPDTGLDAGADTGSS